MKSPVKDIKWLLYPLGDITQWYGENEELYTNGFKDSYPEYYEKAGKFIHSGIDIVRPYGEHIFAVEGGTVFSVENSSSGYGKHIKIRTDKDKDGVQRDWVYAHLSYIHVEEGDVVPEGFYIANMGNTGFVVSNSTGNGYWDNNPFRGTHLHLGYRIRKNGKVQDYYNCAFGRVDPLPLFLDEKLLSTKILKTASNLQDKTLYRFAQLLVKIGM